MTFYNVNIMVYHENIIVMITVKSWYHHCNSMVYHGIYTMVIYGMLKRKYHQIQWIDVVRRTTLNL